MQAHRILPEPGGDLAAQRAVLGLVLEAAPQPLAIPDLAREIDGTERAVSDLVGVGLLECQCDSVRATLAALHFDRLELP